MSEAGPWGRESETAHVEKKTTRVNHATPCSEFTATMYRICRFISAMVARIRRALAAAVSGLSASAPPPSVGTSAVPQHVTPAQARSTAAATRKMLEYDMDRG